MCALLGRNEIEPRSQTTDRNIQGVCPAGQGQKRILKGLIGLGPLSQKPLTNPQNHWPMPINQAIKGRLFSPTGIAPQKRRVIVGLNSSEGNIRKRHGGAHDYNARHGAWEIVKWADAAGRIKSRPSGSADVIGIALSQNNMKSQGISCILSPKGAETHQPRASPWENGFNRI